MGELHCSKVSGSADALTLDRKGGIKTDINGRIVKFDSIGARYPTDAYCWGASCAEADDKEAAPKRGSTHGSGAGPSALMVGHRQRRPRWWARARRGEGEL